MSTGQKRATERLNDGSAGKEKLEDLGGIEYFTGLTYLNCGYNNLKELDIRPLSGLSWLYCTHQTESNGENELTLQLTLILTGEQKLKLGLEENTYVKPVVYN